MPIPAWGCGEVREAATPADRTGAFICSFECGFCEACARGELAGTCPNCAGGLLPRPPRAAALLERFPPSA
jgi:hypothetical protein